MNRRRVLAASALVLALAGCSHHAKSVAQLSGSAPSSTSSANLPGSAPVAAPSGTVAASGPLTTGKPTSGPTSTGRPTSKPTPTTAPACNGGNLTFGKIIKPYVLTRATPPFTVTGVLKPPPYTAIKTVNAAVLGGPQVPAMTVYRAFAAKAGFDPDSKLLGQVYDGADLTATTTSLPAGTYVLYRSVHAVQATFTYRCGSAGEPYEGFVTSALSESQGAVNCAKSLPSGSHDDAKAAKATCAKTHS